MEKLVSGKDSSLTRRTLRLGSVWFLLYSTRKLVRQPDGSMDGNPSEMKKSMRQEKASVEPDGSDYLLDVTPYMSTSVFTVYDKFSIERAYLLFRSMGLAHLPVIDEHNVVVGMITRKVRMGFLGAVPINLLRAHRILYIMYPVLHPL